MRLFGVEKLFTINFKHCWCSIFKDSSEYPLEIHYKMSFKLIVITIFYYLQIIIRGGRRIFDVNKFLFHVKKIHKILHKIPNEG